MTLTLLETAEPVGELPSVPGLDVAAGLRCVLGRQGRYAELLRRYVADQESTVDEIRSALSGGDWQAAARIAHTCKGVAATVGAQAVADLAAWLEVLIRGQQHAEGAVRALERVLSRQLAAIRAWLDSNSQQPSLAEAQAPVPVSARPLARLVELLSSDDAVAPEFLRQQASALRGALPRHFDCLQAAVREFDYPLALRIVSDAGGRGC